MIEEFVLEEIQNNLGYGNREGTHISDLLSPKQAYWKKIMPMKASKHELMYWITGHAHESLFLHVSDLKHGKAKQWEGIWYTPDVFFNFPVELKTTRRGFVVQPGKEDKDYEHYLKQLRFYCSAENIQQGWLLVWYLVMMDGNRRQTKPDYFAYRVEFTKEELDKTRQGMLDMRALLETSIKEKDPTHLPDCEKWMCYKEKTVMLEKPHCLKCNKDFQTLYGIKKHITSKTGKGHEVKYGRFETVREPRCKYSLYCKPVMYKLYEEWAAKNLNTEESEEDDAG